jgi:hypothetical protein
VFKSKLSLSCVLSLVALCACEATDPSNVVSVDGQITAILSGDGMPANEPRRNYKNDELDFWLDLDGLGKLQGFEAHHWDGDLVPGAHEYRLKLEFPPTTVAGETDLIAARVCISTCARNPKRDGCGGTCFDDLRSGKIEIVDISKDGKTFDIDFELEVADAEGQTVKVATGNAHTLERN